MITTNNLSVVICDTDIPERLTTWCCWP